MLLQASRFARAEVLRSDRSLVSNNRELKRRETYQLYRFEAMHWGRGVAMQGVERMHGVEVHCMCTAHSRAGYSVRGGEGVGHVRIIGASVALKAVEGLAR